MKTIIDEAIQAFADRHNDRCLKITQCKCNSLIMRAHDYEAVIEKRIKSELGGWLSEERDRWVIGKNQSEMAEWIESIFNHAIKYMEAKK